MANNRGLTIVVIGVGSIVAWAGLENQKITTVIQSVLQGKKPQPGTGMIFGTGSAGTTGGGVTPVGGSPAGGSPSQNKALGQQMCAAAGWTGEEWTAFNNIAMAESGWSNTAQNPSGAAGIAQNINGFGPGYEENNPRQQIAWMINYIRGRYGDPIKAWAFHVANGYY